MRALSDSEPACGAWSALCCSLTLVRLPSERAEAEAAAVAAAAADGELADGSEDGEEAVEGKRDTSC